MPDRITDAGPLVTNSGQVTIYRIGYNPDPFAWTPWQYATDGRFSGRWDDPNGTYRTLYVGTEMVGCLLEVLADFRPDLTVLAGIAAIDDAGGIDEENSTLPAGTIPVDWLVPRTAGTAVLTGDFVDVRRAPTIASLRARFGAFAAHLGLLDLDAAAIKSSAPRKLTQAISAWLYQTTRPPVSGICFASRFGDELTMRAIFEQPGEDLSGTAALGPTRILQLSVETPEVVEAMRIHGLTWA